MTPTLAKPTIARRPSLTTTVMTLPNVSAAGSDDDPPGGDLGGVNAFNFTFLIFGYPRVGKTRLCLSLALDRRAGRTYYLDSTNGTEGIRHQLATVDATVRACADSKALKVHLDWLLAHPGRYQTLVVDDFTEVFDLTKVAVAKSKGRGTPDNLEGLDFGAIYDRMLEVIRMFSKLASPIAAGGCGMNVIVTCWSELEDHPTEPGTKLIVPLFAGKFGYKVPGFFSIVGHLFANTRSKLVGGKSETTFYNQLDTLASNALVGDRWGKLPGKMPYPTGEMIFDAIYEGGDALQEARRDDRPTTEPQPQTEKEPSTNG